MHLLNVCWSYIWDHQQAFFHGTWATRNLDKEGLLDGEKVRTLGVQFMMGMKSSSWIF